MLIKEYRIPLPLSVEEYRIAQLYMIQKKSRQESKGEGSGIQILINRPYEDGPGGGSGQFTHKIFHVGSHLPGWFRSILPKSALMVEEEAWNAYPYTKTRYTCPFVEKFSLEIETFYLGDRGNTDNVFGLSPKDVKAREVDLLDVVNDTMWSSDYSEAEDPTLYVSEKTGRGPLGQDWIREAKTIMCAYKLCKVEFRYWGMQSKIEKFIHDVGLRKTMHRAHRQAWAWQDEWVGLTIADIRRLELEAQEELAQKMRDFAAQDDEETLNSSYDKDSQADEKPKTKPYVDSEPQMTNAIVASAPPPSPPPPYRSCLRPPSMVHRREVDVDADILSWRMRAIARDDDEDSIPSIGEDDHFFDALEPEEADVLPCNFPISSSTSMELLQIDEAEEADEMLEEDEVLSPAQSFKTLDTISTTASFLSCPDDFGQDYDVENDDFVGNGLAPLRIPATDYNHRQPTLLERSEDQETLWRATLRHAYAALKQRPEDVNCINLMAQSKFAIGELKEAKKYCVRAMNVSKKARFNDEINSVREAKELNDKIHKILG